MSAEPKHLPRTASSTEAVLSPNQPAGLWTRFHARHLFDYNAAATRLWLILVGTGLLTLAWALTELPKLPLNTLLQVLVGVGVVATAGAFPVHIPRTKYSVSVAEVFIFSMLALYGVPAAVLAAGADGLVATSRSSKRLTSRLSSPSTMMLGMALSGALFAVLDNGLMTLGWPLSTASLAALCIASLPYFACNTLPLLAVIAAKSGQMVSVPGWIRNYSWLAAIYLLSAAVAGVLALNARQFGPSVFVVAAAVAAVVVLLMNHSLGQQEAERQAQESKVAEAQREVLLNQQRFTASFTHAAIGMAIVRPDGSIHQANKALCALLACDEAQLLTKPFTDLLHKGDAALFSRRTGGASGAEAESFSMELRCERADGEPIWVSLHCGRYIEPGNDKSGLIYQLHDISQRRQAEGELHHIAFHDSLTDLANRNCFNERLAVAVERSRTDADQRFAVMFLDLDRFKVVNDSLGHIAGNFLLQAVARRISASVRPGDLVARLGGDEFAVLLEQVHAPAEALALAQRLLGSLAEPLMINGTEVLPGASIGVTLSDLGYRSTDEVLRDADLAMYAAKAAGRHRVALFDNSMHERIAEKLKLEGDLRRAIGEGQLSLAYQPLFDLNPYRLSGFEALARWVHPERGPIGPDVFIALAEESGHIEALTAWVVDQAVSQLTRWHALYPQMVGLDMHVNISGRDLAQPSLVPHVREVLARHGLAAHQLTLEITESTLMEQIDAALVALHSLREVGVKFSIDDFGTGYSSLAYLSTLPIDSLKIDRSFVIGMAAKPQNVEIVRAVINLGRSLGKKVIAEGIETEEQLATLKALGVHVGQGYLMSRPLRADQVPALFAVAEPADAEAVAA